MFGPKLSRSIEEVVVLLFLVYEKLVASESIKNRCEGRAKAGLFFFLLLLEKPCLRFRFPLLLLLAGSRADGGKRNESSTVSVDQMFQSNVRFFQDLNRLVKKKCYIFRIRVARDLVFL